MIGTEFRTAVRNPAPLRAPPEGAAGGPRRVAFVANGRRLGSLARFITPWDVGELTRPFVLLNYAEAAQRSRSLFGAYPPSHIASLTVVLDGELSFEDAAGKRGEVAAAGFTWMRAGGVVWHEGDPAARGPLRVFHLWIAYPGAPPGSGSPNASEFITADEVEEDGPVRVLLGAYGRARGPLRQAPADVNCLHVRLKYGEQFRYVAPHRHNVTWLAVDRGGLQAADGARVLCEQFALFEDSDGVIEVQADCETSFVLGSAPRSPQERR